MQSKKILEIDIQPQVQNNLTHKFPSINFTSTSRALMSLSKKERLDSNDFISIQLSRQMRLKKQMLEQYRTTTLNAEFTLNKFRQTQKSKTKISKTLHFVKKFDRQKLQAAPNLAKIQKKKITPSEESTQQNPSKIPNKQQNNTLFNGHVKYCDQKFGWVQGYAVSSHIGTLCTSNNTRICVATNLFRNSNKLKQVSFFGLFQGKNGSNRAQYMRQYFHNILVNDELFYYNFQKAVMRSFQKMDRDFSFDPRYDGDYSEANTVICVLVGTKMNIIRYGAPKATISMNFGSYIKTLSFEQKKTVYNMKQRKSISNLSTIHSKLYTPKQQIHVRSFQLNEKFDYLILGNEGLYQAFNNKNDLGTFLWKSMLDDQSSNLSTSLLTAENISKLGKVCNKICEQVIRKDVLGRCASMIVVQFNNMSLCFEESSPIQLPLDTNRKSEETKTKIDFKQEENMKKREKMEQKNNQTLQNLMRSLSNML